jgi:hypothetical protein
VEFADQYLIKIESSENKQHQWSGKPEKEAEKNFAKRYPAIHGFFEPLRKRLTTRYDQGKYFWELRSCAYWHEFEQPKVAFPDIAPSAQFAWDDHSRYLVNTSYILLAPKWTLPVLNSIPVLWFYQNTSNAIRGGYLRYIHQYVELIPIPPAMTHHQGWCERLADALIFLNNSEGKKAKDELPGLMIAYFEQWVNGLVYEMFFPSELHDHKLKLFDETVKLNPPDLVKVSESRKGEMLQEVFAKAYDTNAALRGMLFDLRSLEMVRVIEDVSGTKEKSSVENEA